MSTHSPYGNWGYAMLTANALRTPDKPALVYHGEELTFAALDAQVNRIANALLAAGVARGHRVGSLMGDAMAIAKLYPAEAKIGAIIAALNPYWDEAQIVATCEHSRLDAFIFDAAHAEKAARVRAKLPGIKLWLSTSDLDALAAKSSAEAPPLGAFDDDPVAFFYTSGTTGVSKAVVHSHASCKSVCNFLLELPREEGDVWGTGPIIWGVGYPSTLGGALSVGMKTALEDDFGPRGFLEAVQRERISHAILLPSQCADILANHPHENYDLGSLRVLVLGAEPIGASLLAKLRKRLPGVALHSFYGQTEAPFACLGRLSDKPQDDGVGRPRIGCAVQILDPKGKRVVGEAGELAIAGPHRMVEYLGLPDKNAECLRDGWFFGGDLGMIDKEGRLHIIGRKEDAISKGGRYIRPMEIEDAVMAIPGVGEAGVVGAPAAGIEQKIILAVAPESGRTLSEPALRAALAERLPEGQLPDLIVIADELPHTQDASGGRGKLLRRAIRDRYEGML